MDELASLGRLLAGAKLRHALIGAHAVNAWVSPRFTADIDFTVQASSSDIVTLKEILAAHGYTLAREQGSDQPSGPDFLSFTPGDGVFILEVQVAKTEFQTQVVARAKEVGDGLRVATPEDLIVMKLIANRPKDRADLAELIQLPDIDWAYVEEWAEQWEVLDLLDEVRNPQD